MTWLNVNKTEIILFVNTDQKWTNLQKIRRFYFSTVLANCLNMQIVKKKKYTIQQNGRKHLHVQVVPISFQLLVSRIDFYIYKLFSKV